MTATSELRLVLNGKSSPGVVKTETELVTVSEEEGYCIVCLEMRANELYEASHLQ